MKRGLIGFILGIALSAQALAHSVEYQVIKGGVGVEIKYGDGMAMSYSEVKVYAPKKSEDPKGEKEFQSGRTDANGRFIFYPDRPGKWKIIATDGMMHGSTTTIEVDENLIISKTQTEGVLFRFDSRLEKLIIGLSLIFGATGIWLWFSARRMIKAEKKAGG